jgi:N-dimethylarginine dimethylaminohydrolase
MTYSVHQSWDQLKVCVVGQSFPPEYFSSITDVSIRSVLERIAEETENDYQHLIQTLKKFQVEIVRTKLSYQFIDNTLTGKQFPPPMTPRDHMAMIGDTFFMPSLVGSKWNMLKGSDWPNPPPMSDNEFMELSDQIKTELLTFGITSAYDIHDYDHSSLQAIEQLVLAQGNTIIYDCKIDTAMVARVGKDLYFGTQHINDDITIIKLKMQKLFPDYRCHVINTGGHLDGTFCVVKPGLIISTHDITPAVFEEHFPEWEVFYLAPAPITDNSFLALKQKNQGKWYVPGQEQNDHFIDYVETYIKNWLGYVEETTIDVNMLSIDENNILCIQENPKMFEVFNRHGITPHIVNFRHYKFWDGGLHCITNDLDRQGQQQDYFPERNRIS